MSEEQQEGGMSTLKKTILGVLTTAVTGAGVYVTTNINKFFGVEDEEKTEQVAPAPAQAAPIVLNIDNSSQNNSSNSGGGTTVIKETVREVAVPQPAAVPVEEKEETPIERMKRLKAEKAKQDGN